MNEKKTVNYGKIVAITISVIASAAAITFFLEHFARRLLLWAEKHKKTKEEEKHEETTLDELEEEMDALAEEQGESDQAEDKQ